MEAKDGSFAPGWAKMKKADLAALAEREIAGTGWLAAPVRIDDAASQQDAEEDTEALSEAAE